VYVKAIQSIQAGHDPYVDGISAQVLYHQRTVHLPTDQIPYTYVYSPMTLPLLRALGHLPMAAVDVMFWTIYFAGMLLAVWVGMQFVEPQERRVFALLAPVAIFFPGLLQNDVLFSGNIAFILYGLILPAALLGWRRGRWTAFYVAVLVASCWKAPLLTLLVLPVMSAESQIVPAGATFALGAGLFAAQPRLWPVLFQNFLRAVDLQFQWNHDFGCNPAGVLADVLYAVLPYRLVYGAGYAVVGLVVVGVLWRLRPKFLSGEIPLTRWAPLLLVSVVLLNPRIMEYDVVAVTVPMALLMWRFFAGWFRRQRNVAVAMVIFFGVINGFAPFAWNGYAPFVGVAVQGAVLAIVFAAGVWEMMRVASVERH
jgi:hypothetical protein